jgi:predicted transcriptional regulator
VGVRQLGELEAAVMDRLWARGEPATVRQVLDTFTGERELAYTTVMTVMDKLHRKGLLARERVGRAWRYHPTSSREDYTAGLLQQVLETTDDRAAALMRFVERMPPAEVRDLRSALDRARRGRGRP